MSDESNFQDEDEDFDFENMKVIELKLRLKSLGLSATGNKSELVERLQNAINSEKVIDSAPEVDSTLLNDSNDTIALNASDNPLLEDFSLSPPEKEQLFKSVDSTTNSNPASMPLKKRAVAQAAAETVKVEKKLIINRNNIPTPQIIVPSKPAVPSRNFNIITIDSTDKKSTNDDKESKDIINENSKDGRSVIRLSSAPAKSLSEKFVLRAERFKSSSSTDQSKTQVITSPLGATAISNHTPISSSVDLSSMEALKKRAERFGQNVSTIMKKMEDEQRIQKRKCKFGSIGTGNGVSTAEEQEKKKKRAERFGI